MRSLIGGSLLIALSATTLAQSPARHPYTSFVAGTLAQDIVAVPKSGWTIIVGSTTDPNYPVTAGAFDRTCGTDGACNVFQGRFGPDRMADIVLTMFDADGEIRYSTFLGGAARDDNPRIALASDGVWVAGNSTAGAFEHVSSGCATSPITGGLVVTRFDYTLQRVEQQICLTLPTLADLELDPDGTLWVLGTTGVQVATVNAFQPIMAGQQDLFLAHLSPAQSTPLMSTYIGGNRFDAAAALALTPTGDIAIVGSTTSTNFPLVRPVRTTPPASVVWGDAAVLVLDRSGRFLEFSTYFGGRFDDSAVDVAVDAGGNLYVAGTTASSDLPVTTGAYDSVCDSGANPAGCRDAFVTTFRATGEVAASTFFGGTALDIARGLALRENGDVVLLGLTQSPDLPLVGGQPFQHWRPSLNFAHSFLATFDQQQSRLTRSVFIGDEQRLPSVPQFAIHGAFAYVTGQLGESTGAPVFGNYLSAVPLQ